MLGFCYWALGACFHFRIGSLVPHPDLTQDQLSLFPIPPLVNHSDQLISTTMANALVVLHAWGDARREKKAAKQKASCHAHTKTNPPVSVDCMRAMLFLRAITSQSSLCDHHIPTDGNAIVQ